MGLCAIEALCSLQGTVMCVHTELIPKQTSLLRILKLVTKWVWVGGRNNLVYMSFRAASKTLSQ